MNEPFSGGLVTARDPSLLEPGELQACDDCIYLPSSPSLHKAPGRSAFNAVAISLPRGLRYLAFDGGDNLLVALSGNDLRKATGVQSGTFASAYTGVNGDSLDSANFGNKHFLFAGGDKNLVVLKDGTVRRHGLAPATVPPGVVVTTTGGVWPLSPADTLPGYYEYWVTELYKSDLEEVESTFTGTPQTVYISSSVNYATLTMPTPVNAAATHWRVYRSERKNLATDISFPLGWLIAEISIDTTTFKDGISVTTALKLPTAVSTVKPFGLLDFTFNGYPIDSHTFKEWTTSPSSILLDDAVVATSPSLDAINRLPLGAPTYSINQWTALTLSGFAFGTIGEPITNFTVEIEGRRTSGTPVVKIYASWDGGIATITSTASAVPLTASTAIYTIDCGTFGRTWEAGEVSDASFRLIIDVRSGVTTGAVEFDYVKVSVSHGGATGSQETSFPFVEVSYAGISFVNGANGEPPDASTGDIFRGTLVTNDLAEPNIIRYALSEQPDYFPPEYFIAFDTRERDTVTCVRSLGNLLIVGLYTSSFLVNYLPRAEDPSFSRGDVVDEIAGAHGIVGPQAAVKFMSPGGAMTLAYVSRYGLMATNGYQANTLTDDLDWEATVNINALNDCILINDARHYSLTLYYAPPGSSENTKKLHFSYHPSHIKNGKLKVSGPARVYAVGAAHAIYDDGTEGLYTLSSSGVVYVENQGTSDAAGLGIAPHVVTREIYPNGLGREAKITKVLVHHATGADNLTLTATTTRTNATSLAHPARKFAGQARGFARIPMVVECEGVSFALDLADSASDLTLNYMVVDEVSQSLESSPA